MINCGTGILPVADILSCELYQFQFQRKELLYQIRVYHPRYSLVGAGRLCFCSSGFNRRIIKGISNTDLVLNRRGRRGRGGREEIDE
jgi:hypothetical protein